MLWNFLSGTASVVVAGLLATTRVTGKKLSEQKMVFLGAGAVGNSALFLEARWKLISSRKRCCQKKEEKRASFQGWTRSR